MMISRKILFTAILFCTTFILISSAHATKPWDEVEDERSAAEWNDADSVTASEEMSSSLYGRITGVDSFGGSFSVVSTNRVEDKSLEQTSEENSQNFKVDDSTSYAGIASLKDISPGDYVTVDFYEFKGTNIADQIVLEKSGGQKPVPSETSNEQDLTDMAQSQSGTTTNKDLVG